MRLPYPHHVGEEAKEHQWVDGALVLEEHVEQRLLAGDLRREEQIGVRLPQVRVDEVARAEGECGEVDAGGEGRRQDRLELAGRVLDLGEGGLEEGVVNAGRHRRVTMPEARGVGMFLEKYAS